MPTIEFQLRPTPPFRLDLTAWTLRRRATNLVDAWDGETYRRAMMLNDRLVGVQVRQAGTREHPRLFVSVTGSHVSSSSRTQVTNGLVKLLGLRIDLAPFYRLAAVDPQLGPLVARFKGAKPPRYLSLFEALANAIACQQISLSQGIALLNRLAVKYGPLEETTELHAFPRPEDLAHARPASLVKLGFSRQKAIALLELATGIESRTVDLIALDSLDNQSAVDHLCRLRGVGRWTAEYVLLRGLGRLDVFPGDDVGARNNLQRWLDIREPLNYAGIRALVARWQPYAGMVYFHLLLDRLAGAGALSESAPL